MLCCGFVGRGVKCVVNLARPRRSRTVTDTEIIPTLAGPEMKQCDWLILVIGPRTVLVV